MGGLPQQGASQQGLSQQMPVHEVPEPEDEDEELKLAMAVSIQHDVMCQQLLWPPMHRVRLVWHVAAGTMGGQRALMQS